MRRWFSVTWNILNKTYFQAIQEIVDAVFDQDGTTASKYFTNKVGSFVPNIISKINNDPYLRDAQGIIDEVIGKRLGVGTPPSPKYNFMGEAHKASDEDSIQRFFNNFLNPLSTFHFIKSGKCFTLNICIAVAKLVCILSGVLSIICNVFSTVAQLVG